MVPAGKEIILISLPGSVGRFSSRDDERFSEVHYQGYVQIGFVLVLFPSAVWFDSIWSLSSRTCLR